MFDILKEHIMDTWLRQLKVEIFPDLPVDGERINRNK